MSAHPDYSAAWHDYRRRRLVFWILFLGFVPGVWGIFWGIGRPLSAMSGIKPDYFFYPIAGAWMLAFVIASIRLGLFACPRCRNWFFSTWWSRNPDAKTCVHCGLPKWANANSDATSRTPPSD